MSGRPKQIKADTEAMKQLYGRVNNTLDARSIIALTMRNCGCTFSEIAEVMGLTRARAEQIVKVAKAEL